MRIAFVVPSLIRSGPIKVVHQLAHGLASEHEVVVFYLEERTDREKLDFSVPTKKLSFFSPLDFSNFDIVHSHTIKADLFVAIHRKNFSSTKTVTTLHNYAKEDLLFSYGKVKGGLLLWLWEWATNGYDRIVVLSHHAESYYRKLWQKRDYYCIYNGVECPSPISDKKKIYTEKRVRIGVIASAGGLNRRKGVDQIIRALTKLPRYELHVAGARTEETRSLEALAETLGVKKRVLFHGYVSDIASFIAEIDFFIVASRSEGFPLALQEIACKGKPLICSDIPLFREIFTEDEVRFFELENIESLVRAIDGYEQVGAGYAQKAHSRYLAEYTPQKMVENYLRIYEELMK
ncbi:glycosyltransferase family 4 protein [Nitratifractor salsuginis]|uniref:Glycosyl transferase group 1 n=1 Tax=Nitratifractor salsuginis (strain DSM 16511 / JCM 12458 / E9I37-1) TaxID=749222 RepID=E6X2V4_NITSE|nr:glycosyltransferase family 4 protein [Nitratifractor salsuginis]ADV47237.1 glycosyl transferase group 1 [Nitratifractor salsuginis DSM 16511]